MEILITSIISISVYILMINYLKKREEKRKEIYINTPEGKKEYLRKKVESGKSALIELNKECSSLKHLEQEYRAAFKDFEKDEMQLLLFKNLRETLAIISEQGHSGSSIKYFMNHLNLLIDFKPLSDITFEEEDFKTVIWGNSANTTKQHIRNSRYFLKEGVISFNDHCVFKSDFRTNETMKVEKGSGTTWSGSIRILVDTDGNWRFVKFTGNIKDIDSYKAHDKPFVISTYEIEIPEDWWIAIVFIEDIREYENIYEIDKSEEVHEEALNKEILNFKEGIYKDLIFKAIDICTKHKRPDTKVFF